MERPGASDLQYPQLPLAVMEVWDEATSGQSLVKFTIVIESLRRGVQ